MATNDESSSGPESGYSYKAKKDGSDAEAEDLLHVPRSDPRKELPSLGVSSGDKATPMLLISAEGGYDDAEGDWSTSQQEKDNNEDGRNAIAISTTRTSPASRSSSSIRFTSPSKDWTYDEVGRDVTRASKIEEFPDTCNQTSSPHSEDGLLRAAIGGLKQEDFPWDPARPREPTIVTDAGYQQFKGQKRIDSFFPAPISLVNARQQNLQRQIYQAIHRTSHPQAQPSIQGPGFIPKAQLDYLITPETVACELTRHVTNAYSDEQVAQFAEEVCQDIEVKLHDSRIKLRSYKPVFALLVLVEMAPKIVDFLVDKVSDLDLPLVEIGDGTGWIDIGRSTPLGVPSEPLRCFSEWTLMNRVNFLRYQWTMLAPFFRESKYNDVQHYALQDHHIIPLMMRSPEHSHDEDYVEYSGGFGIVFLAHIHPEHHNFNDPLACRRGFAIKQLHEKNPIYFDREVSILEKFVGANAHKHVVSLLATYQRCGKYHMIFYRAQGDLFRYWKEINPSPELTFDTVQWMAKQCEGISDGLARLHKHRTLSPVQNSAVKDEAAERPSLQVSERGYKRGRAGAGLLQSKGRKRKREAEVENDGAHKGATQRPRWQWGRHGDLKPENILWFQEGESSEGTLKISDFGQAELHEWLFNTHKRSQVADTMTYRAPECDLEPSKARQSSDMWSLGCVFLEYVTWMLGGAELLVDFSQTRLANDVFQGANMKTDTFFEIAYTEGSDQWGVAVKPAVTKFIRRLHSHPRCSEFFHDFLNLIEDKMLVIELRGANTRRLPCSQIQRHLKDMYERCRRSRAYATTPTPSSERSNLPDSVPKLVRPAVAEEAIKVITKNKALLPVYGRTENNLFLETKHWAATRGLLPRSQTN